MVLEKSLRDIEVNLEISMKSTPQVKRGEWEEREGGEGRHCHPYDNYAIQRFIC